MATITLSHQTVELMGRRGYTSQYRSIKNWPTYEGWSSYEAWKISLTANNDIGLYSQMASMVDTYLTKGMTVGVMRYLWKCWTVDNDRQMSLESFSSNPKMRNAAIVVMDTEAQEMSGGRTYLPERYLESRLRAGQWEGFADIENWPELSCHSKVWFPSKIASLLHRRLYRTCSDIDSLVGDYLQNGLSEHVMQCVQTAADTFVNRKVTFSVNHPNIASAIYALNVIAMEVQEV